MAGSNDGVVRLFRNIDEPSNLEIVSGWRALSDVMPTNKISRLILDWQQFTGSLLCSGDVRVIRIWDAQHELCMQVCIPSLLLLLLLLFIYFILFC